MCDAGDHHLPARYGFLVEALEVRALIADPEWPTVLATANELNPDAILVSCYKRVPRSRDAASMLSRPCRAQ